MNDNYFDFGKIIDVAAGQRAGCRKKEKLARMTRRVRWAWLWLGLCTGGLGLGLGLLHFTTRCSTPLSPVIGKQTTENIIGFNKRHISSTSSARVLHLKSRPLNGKHRGKMFVPSFRNKSLLLQVKSVTHRIGVRPRAFA